MSIDEKDPISELAYTCAACGGLAFVEACPLDSGTTFTHDDPACGGKTVVTLSTPAEYCRVALVMAAASMPEDR
jgi:hypothetical protein